MEEDEPRDEGSFQGSGSRACDNCRARKIKCDRASPCSNCRASQSICRTSPRFKEQRQRVLISHQYEKRIESIDERLTGIEDILRDLAINLPRNQAPGTGAGEPEKGSGLPAETLLAPTGLENAETTESTPEFEGDSSLIAHSVHASKLFEKTMGKSPHFEHNPEIIEALNSLKEIVRKQSLPSSVHALRFSSSPTTKPIDLSQLRMPSTEEVLSLLRHCKDKYPDFFLSMPVIDLEYFKQACREVYFCTEEYSPRQFAIVNCILGYLFEERAVSQPGDQSATKFADYSALCIHNFETVIDSFNLFMEPSFQNLLVLSLGILHAAQNSKVSLCWNLTCAGARMCQSLGYHRSVAGKNDKTEDIGRKKMVFWFIYIMDKDVSLCLGRTSTFQDYDIAVEYPEVPDDPLIRPWIQVYQGWIKCAKTSGEIYEHLYSTRALTDDAGKRTKKAHELADELGKWREDFMQIETTGMLNNRYFELLIPGVDMVYHLFLTLIYRVIPPTQPPETPSGLSRDCVESARKSMQIHQQFATSVKDKDSYAWKGYIDWTLLHCPFAPYMVLFCHTITATSLDDLKLLEEVSSSLQTVGRLSEAAQRLYRLFSVFYQVAKAYVNAQLNELEQAYSEPPIYPHFGAEFDPFLSALGMAPPLAGPPPSRVMEETTTGGPGIVPEQNPPEYEMGQTLEGWFLGNQYMMGLLESDI